MLKAFFAGHLPGSLNALDTFPPCFSSSTVSFLRPSLSLEFQMLLCHKFIWSHYCIDSVIFQAFPSYSQHDVHNCLFVPLFSSSHTLGGHFHDANHHHFLSDSITASSDSTYTYTSLRFFFFLKKNISNVHNFHFVALSSICYFEAYLQNCW